MLWMKFCQTPKNWEETTFYLRSYAIPDLSLTISIIATFHYFDSFCNNSYCKYSQVLVKLLGQRYCILFMDLMPHFEIKK